MATYGGASVFGGSVTVEMTPAPSESQVSAFFGVSGTFSTFGGTRGRSFRVTGLLGGATPEAVAAARDTLLSYDDGIGRVLYDPVENVSWPQVVFTGAFRWTGPFGAAATAGSTLWVRPYECLFVGRV